MLGDGRLYGFLGFTFGYALSPYMGQDTGVIDFPVPWRGVGPWVAGFLAGIADFNEEYVS